ncbi:MAG: hypothetical protein JW785_01695 [Acidimicrobiia bacterium]|nr:hypothetical protein [Acidimicrobiia bacterium]
MAEPLPPRNTPGSPAPDPWARESAQESALAELLRSPLDEAARDREGVPRGRALSAALFLAAALAGTGFTVLGYRLAASNEGGAAASAPTTAATATTAAGPVLPAGYQPLGEGYGARVERILLRPDAAFVSLTFSVDAEHDPTETLGHQGGQWLLEFPDGTTLQSSAVVFDPVARAAATIAFPPFDSDPASATLRLVSVEEIHTAEFSAAGAGSEPALPEDGGMSLTLEPATFALEGGGTLRLGALTLERGAGALEWTVEGGGGKAYVNPTVTLEGTTEVALILHDPFFDLRSRALSDPPPPLAAAGRAELIPLNPTVTDPGGLFRVTLRFEATWTTSSPAAAVFTLAGADVVDLTASA